MLRLLISLAVCLALAPPHPARGDEIEPDRPDLTTGARPVGRRVVQLESGVLYQRTSLAGGPAERRLSVEATLRLGMTDWLELVVEGEPVVRLRGAEQDTGSGDYTFGAKLRLWAPPEGTRWPTVSLLAVVKPAVADATIGSGRHDFGLVALASFELPAEVSLDLNAGAAALGQRPDGYLGQAAVSAAASRKLTQQLAAFVEFVFSTREEREGADEAAAHTGLSWLLSPDVAVDASVLTSLMGPAPDYALRAGLSVRFRP